MKPWHVEENKLEFSKETKKNILQAEKEIREGKTKTIEKIKLELGARKNIYKK